MESGTESCPLPEKYRALEDGEGDEPFEWLKPSEFVERYKASPYYTLTEKRIQEIIDESSGQSNSERKEVINL